MRLRNTVQTQIAVVTSAVGIALLLLASSLVIPGVAHGGFAFPPPIIPPRANSYNAEIAFEPDGKAILAWTARPSPYDDVGNSVIQAAYRGDLEGPAPEIMNLTEVRSSPKIDPVYGQTRIASGPDGRTAVVWDEFETVSQTRKVMISIKEPGERSFGAPINVSGTTVDSLSLARDPDVAVGPDGEVTIVWFRLTRDSVESSPSQVWEVWSSTIEAGSNEATTPQMVSDDGGGLPGWLGGGRSLAVESGRDGSTVAVWGKACAVPIPSQQFCADGLQTSTRLSGEPSFPPPSEVPGPGPSAFVSVELEVGADGTTAAALMTEAGRYAKNVYVTVRPTGGTFSPLESLLVSPENQPCLLVPCPSGRQLNLDGIAVRANGEVAVGVSGWLEGQEALVAFRSPGVNRFTTPAPVTSFSDVEGLPPEAVSKTVFPVRSSADLAYGEDGSLLYSIRAGWGATFPDLDGLPRWRVESGVVATVRQAGQEAFGRPTVLGRYVDDPCIGQAGPNIGSSPDGSINVVWSEYSSCPQAAAQGRSPDQLPLDSRGIWQGIWTADRTGARLGTLQITGPRKPRASRRSTYRVKVRNVGGALARGVKVTARGKGAKRSRKLGPLAAGKSKTVTLPLRFRKRGKVRLTFTVTSNNAGKKKAIRTVRVR